MASFRRRKPRAARSSGYSAKGLAYRLGISRDEARWLGNWPRSHDIIMHARPTRREVHRLETGIVNGRDPDEACWPDGSKPHHYYW